MTQGDVSEFVLSIRIIYKNKGVFMKLITALLFSAYFLFCLFFIIILTMPVRPVWEYAG